MLDLIYLRNKLSRFLKKNASKKKLIVVNSFNKIETSAKAIKECTRHFGSNTTILCFKSEIPKAFNDTTNNIMLSEDYLAKGDYAEIDSHVFNDISKNWAREAQKKFRDVFTYNNVELPQIAEYDLQLFLMIKVKALAVITKAIKKEDYEAVFIIDSNRELEDFEKFLSGLYSIPVDFAAIYEKKSPVSKLRNAGASLLSGIVDNFSLFLIKDKKDIKFIDARLFYSLGIENTDNFLLVPFEKGLNLRLKCLSRNRGYASFVWGQAFNREGVVPGQVLSPLRRQFVFEGIPYWGLVKKKINTLITHDFSRFRRNIDILTGAHERHNIKSIILRNAVRELEKTIVLSSKKLNIPTLVIQHGISAEPNGHNTIFADKIAVWGERSVEWYVNLENNSDKMAITGNHNFDSLFNTKDSPMDKHIAEELGLKQKRNLITLITPGTNMLRFSSFVTDDVTENILRAVVKAVDDIGDSNLIVKLHPNEDIKTFKKVVGKKSNTVLVDKINLRKLVKSSDILLTVDSSVALEAIVMEKPVVIINLSKRHDLVPYVEKGVALGAYNSDNILDTIRKALFDEVAREKMHRARGSFTKKFLYQPDDRAKERVLGLIESL